VNDLLRVLGGLGVGVAAGVVFFRGLAVTVARLPTARRPATLMAFSTAARFAVVVVTITLVAFAWDWPAVLAALVGLLGVRALLVRGARVTGRETL
jgi:F1F0 ATPase subunit 2